MLQYLINTTLIWLSCMLIYELLLKKESFHSYNRIYLLLSLAMGLLLPLANLDSLVTADNKVLHQPMMQVVELKRSVFISENQTPVAPYKTAATVSADGSMGFNFGAAIWVLYLIVVAVGLILLTSEIRRLISLYTHGSKSSEDGFTIVATGKDHCPFSFFKIVFIRSRQDYTESEWKLLIAHEQEHGRQLHSLDNIFLIMMRLVFWFNPLSHIYYKRLKTVHEFQADNAAAASPADYGNFLLEQSLLRGAPILTHSFNYSPIKKRIAMLTGTRSKRARLLKYLVVIPLSLILIAFCTQTSLSRGNSSKADRIFFKGNEIVFGGQKAVPFSYYAVLKKQKDIFQYLVLPDSVAENDPVTGEIKFVPVPVDMVPVGINGKPIFGNEARYEMANAWIKYNPPVFIGAEKSFDEYLFSRLKGTLNKLENGRYTFQVNWLVIDDKGNVAYYGSGNIQSLGSRENSPFINDDIMNTIGKKFTELLEGPVKFKPAIKDNKPVNVRLGFDNYEIEVLDHVARLTRRLGC